MSYFSITSGEDFGFGFSSARIANVYIHHIIEVEAIKYISSLK